MLDAEVYLVDTWDEAQSFIWWCEQPHDKVAIDTETTDVGWTARVRTVQFGDRHTAWVIPYERGGWGRLVKEGFYRLRGTTFLMHNFAFDQAVLKHEGLELPDHRVVDTRIKAHLVDPGKPTGLKPLSDRLVGPWSSQGQARLDKTMRKEGWTWATIPITWQDYWFYAGLDTVLTARIEDILDPQIAPWRAVYDLEYRCQCVLKEMRYRGVRVDMRYVERKLRELQAEVDALRDRAMIEFGIRNLTSNDQVAEELIKQGWEPDKWTDTGKPQMTKDVLTGLAWRFPLAELCREAKHLEKMASSQYLGGYGGLVDSNGLIHPNINPLGARTARMTVREPALQTLHRDAVVRDAFVPRDGNKMLFVDYDQQEVRLTAHYSADPDYIQAIMGSKDVHRTSAARIFGVDEDRVDKRMRAITKNAVYAIIYGAGIDKFSLTAGVTRDEGEEFLRSYYQAFPGVRALQDRIQETAAQRWETEGIAYVNSRIGRRHRLNEWEVDGVGFNQYGQKVIYGAGYKLVNYLIQGTGADELKRAIVDLDRQDLSKYMVLVVHDEIGFDVPEKEFIEVECEVLRTMENRDDYLLPLTVGSSGPVERWGEKYRGEGS